MPDDNVWLALQKIEDQHQTSRCSATLQVIMMDPPTLIFYSVKSISVLRNISKEDIVYIDVFFANVSQYTDAFHAVED